ncbi:hypothetical protein Nstercoris_01482 [Nitrosomonas stercoris]|uniref:DUF2914 domain-containing protein n=1 Tax=Nitrosomonas stercoris TaxID=1444684 RepID=A0A4Y1YM44_9PROT|nr:hypothetical protein Nstercoris_01482 [Nitrosomonas stercoris]
MSDNQLKIRIRLDQPNDHPAIEQELSPPQEDAASAIPPATYEYHWRRIIGVSLILLLILALLAWLAFSSNTHDDASNAALSNDLSETTVDLDTDNSSAIAIAEPELPVEPIENSPSAQIIEDQFILDEPIDTDSANPPFESSQDTEMIESDTLPEVVTESLITEEPVTDLPIQPEVKPTVPTDLLEENNTQIELPAGLIKAQLTSNVHQRTPVDTVNSISLANRPSRGIFLFLHFNQFQGKQIFVNWYYRDRRVARVNLPVGTKDWRTYSSKILNRQHLGPWHVTATDTTGKELVKFNFSVTH